jgi:hypothetical protein
VKATAQRDTGSAGAQWCEVGQGPILSPCYRSQKLGSGPSASMVSVPAWGEAWGIAQASA